MNYVSGKYRKQSIFIAELLTMTARGEYIFYERPIIFNRRPRLTLCDNKSKIPKKKVLLCLFLLTQLICLSVCLTLPLTVCLPCTAVLSIVRKCMTKFPSTKLETHCATTVIYMLNEQFDSEAVKCHTIDNLHPISSKAGPPG